VKRLHIPYTIIDVGRWYQFSLPELPSGKINYAVAVATQTIPGNGNVLSALTDLRDVGKYVARVIKDERTPNSMVFVYNELWTSNQVYDLIEIMSGERVVRKYTSAEKYEQRIMEADIKLNHTPEEFCGKGSEGTRSV
jgi:hypothetical protein